MDPYQQQQQQQQQAYQAYQHQHQHQHQTQHQTQPPAMQDPAELLLEQFPEAGKLRWVQSSSIWTAAHSNSSHCQTMQ